MADANVWAVLSPPERTAYLARLAESKAKRAAPTTTNAAAVQPPKPPQPDESDVLDVMTVDSDAEGSVASSSSASRGGADDWFGAGMDSAAPVVAPPPPPPPPPQPQPQSTHAAGTLTGSSPPRPRAYAHAGGGGGGAQSFRRPFPQVYPMVGLLPHPSYGAGASPNASPNAAGGAALSSSPSPPRPRQVGMPRLPNGEPMIAEGLTLSPTGELIKRGRGRPPKAETIVKRARLASPTALANGGVTIPEALAPTAASSTTIAPTAGLPSFALANIFAAPAPAPPSSSSAAAAGGAQNHGNGASNGSLSHVSAFSSVRPTARPVAAWARPAQVAWVPWNPNAWPQGNQMAWAHPGGAWGPPGAAYMPTGPHPGYGPAAPSGYAASPAGQPPSPGGGPAPGFAATGGPAPGYAATGGPAPGYAGTAAPAPGYAGTAAPAPGYAATGGPAPGYAPGSAAGSATGYAPTGPWNGAPPLPPS